MLSRFSLYRSSELRVVAAAVIAAAALGLAFLHVVAERTDVLMLDFQEWQQTGPPSRRPFQITLQLAHPGPPADFLAAERRFEVGEDGCYEFRVYLWSPNPSREARALIYVNDQIAWAAPLFEVAYGGGVELKDLRPRHGALEIRLELRAERRRSAKAAASPSVRFEYATLRRCRDGESKNRTAA